MGLALRSQLPEHACQGASVPRWQLEAQPAAMHLPEFSTRECGHDEGYRRFRLVRWDPESQCVASPKPGGDRTRDAGHAPIASRNLSLLPTSTRPVPSLSCTPGPKPTPHPALLSSHAHESKRPRPLKGSGTPVPKDRDNPHLLWTPSKKLLRTLPSSQGFLKQSGSAPKRSCPQLLALTTPTALLCGSYLPCSPAFEMLSASQTAEPPVHHDGQARAERFALLHAASDSVNVAAPSLPDREPSSVSP